MTKNDKIAWFIENATRPYIEARDEAEQELHKLTPVLCLCGALATDFHTQYCQEYQEQLKTIIINKLQGLLPQNAK